MQKIIQKNFNQRKNFKELEKKKLILKIISKNFFLNELLKIKSKQKFFNFDKSSSITRIKNRCILTGRGKKIFKFFKLTRHQLKKKSSEKLLPGVSKYSW